MRGHGILNMTEDFKYEIDYKYEIRPSSSGSGYQFSVWTPAGILLDCPVNFIPFTISMRSVLRGDYFSGLSMTLRGARRAIRGLVKAHKNHGFKQLKPDGAVESGTIR